LFRVADGCAQISDGTKSIGSISDRIKQSRPRGAGAFKSEFDVGD
jgi:hypothetical protein